MTSTAVDIQQRKGRGETESSAKIPLPAAPLSLSMKHSSDIGPANNMTNEAAI